MLGQLARLTARDHDVNVVLERLIAHPVADKPREGLQQVRSFDAFHRDQGLARSDIEGAFEQVCSKVAVGDDAVQFRLPEGADPQGLRHRTHAAWLLWIGHLAALDDVVLDDHRVSGVAAEDAAPFPHATPAPDQPARQAAQKERHDRRDATASEFLRDEVEHLGSPFGSIVSTQHCCGPSKVGILLRSINVAQRQALLSLRPLRAPRPATCRHRRRLIQKSMCRLKFPERTAKVRGSLSCFHFHQVISSSGVGGLGEMLLLGVLHGLTLKPAT